MKITKDSFIPIINGCLFRYGCLFNSENIISNEKIINYLKNIDDNFCFSECILDSFFGELIRISTNGLGIKSGYELYNYVYKDENLKYITYKYDFDNMTDKKACKLLLKNFEIMEQFKSESTFYKNVLTITLYKIGKLELKN